MVIAMREYGIALILDGAWSQLSKVLQPIHFALSGENSLQFLRTCQSGDLIRTPSRWDYLYYCRHKHRYYYQQQ